MYLMDIDLSAGGHYPTFKQLGPGGMITLEVKFVAYTVTGAGTNP